MASIVKVLLNDKRILPFINNDLPLKNGVEVVVDNDEICEFGIVKYAVKETDVEVKNKVLRIATEEDKEKNKNLLSMVGKDKEIVLQKVKQANIELKLVTVLRSLDEKKILVMYTAEDRVDFRQLVKDLASLFRMRVEMRQISEREEARFVGGCGVCGQEICCRRFLSQPKQTSIRMAKIQGKTLMPNKINGTCGKLMCCLQYEYEDYKEALAKMPPVGSKVVTGSGEGEIIELDCITDTVLIQLKSGNGLLKLKPEEYKVINLAEADEDDR